MALEATHLPLPPGVLVRGSRSEIQRAFGALVPLQPTDWSDDGLICSPRSAPELAAPALRSCPLPVEQLTSIPSWPGPPSAMVSGWYRRSTGHARGPHASRELIQTEGDGFGLLGHPTTAMCLAAIEHLPCAPALDAGCGSGLLAQAWTRRTGLPVTAIDADAAAVRHARSSVEEAGLANSISVQKTQISALTPDRVTGTVLLANIPAQAHRALLDRVETVPPGVVLSGLTRADCEPIAAEWRACGMRVVRAAQRGRWRCLAMVPQ